MGKAYRLGLIIVLLTVGVVAAVIWYESDSDAGAEACRIYKEAAVEAIAPTVELTEIKAMLDDLDDPTRRAFADLITAADSTTFEARRGATEAAAEVRSTCLAEHGVEIVS